MKSVNSLNRILWPKEYWFKASKCQIWLTNTKPFFWESKANIETHSYIKNRNRILWALEYWFKSLKCQIWLTVTKPFFWESETNVETLQKLSPYIWVSCKFVLKSGKSLNRISWAIESCFKASKCQIWLTNTNHFSGNSRQTLKLSKNFLPIFEFSTNLFWSLSKV